MQFKHYMRQLCKTIAIAGVATFCSVNSYAALPLAGPFTTNNGLILDKNGQSIAFQGVSWFGFNTDNHILHGLWTADFDTMKNQMISLGFNAIRIPFQFDFILNSSIKPSSINTNCNSQPNSCNTNVPQDSALHAFQWVVEQFTSQGFFVLLDDHYEDNTYVNNPNAWLQGWKSIAQMFKGNPLVGYDLWNEPDSHNITWEGTTNGPAWGASITSAANAIYAIDPTKLIFIEGTAQGSLESNWGDGFATDNDTTSRNISNPKNFFNQLMFQPYVNQIVISPHMYGPDGTNNQGPDHSNQAQAFQAWSRLHGYLNNNFLNINNTSLSGFCLDCGICHVFPIAVGEFGGKFDPSDPYYQKDVATNLNIASFLNRLTNNGQNGKPNWFYWSWNPNSGNTGGILKDDWRTFDCNKVNFLVQNLGLKPNAGICGNNVKASKNKA